MSRSRHSGEVSSVRRTRPENVLTVISWDTEKRVVGVDNPTFQAVPAGVEQGILLVVGLSLVRHVRHSTGRIRWCSFRTQKVDGSRRLPCPVCRLLRD